MNRKKLSVRAARMELEFALVEGSQDKIKEAEKRLEEALALARKPRASESNEDGAGH